MSTKKPKPKILRGHGHINVSNVNSKNSECITLTYSIKHVGSLKNANELKDELDDLTGEDSNASVEITNLGDGEEQYDMKYKVKTCDNEARAREIKSDVDKHLKKKGGQTTLTEDFAKEKVRTTPV